MSDENQKLYFVGGCILAAVLAAIWLCGALAGLLFGAGWTPLAFNSLVETALRLPSHLGEPRDAWPPAIRSALPGAVGFYVSAALLAGCVCGAFLLLRRAPMPFALPRLGQGRRRVPSARWAKLGDLAPLRVPAPQPGRLTLGRFGRSLLAAEERQSVIVFAPTETHKTSGLAIPALLEWEGPVLVTSVKGDLLAATIGRRASMGGAMVFDPVGVSGQTATCKATPLWGAESWHGAMRVAHWLCSAAQPDRSGLQDADFWFATAEKLLAPLLFTAAASGGEMADVVRWLDEGPEANDEEVAELLSEAGVEDAELAWQATQNREPRQRSSVYTTAEVIVSAFGDERVKEQTEEAEYTPELLLGGKNTLYLCAPLQEQERLRPMFSMLVQELLSFAYEKAATKGPLDPPLLLLLDEAANIAPIPNLDAIASTGAGQGIQLLSVFQDMAQVGTVYGRRAATIVNNHRAKLFGIGISDPETLGYLSRVAGAAEFEQRSRSSGERGKRSLTEGETYRDLAPANVVRERDPGSALLMYHNLPLAKIDLRLWFEDRKLRKLKDEPPDSEQSGAGA
jgi:type IV secretion system protein VirD4